MPYARAHRDLMPIASGVDFREAVAAATDGRRKAGPVTAGTSIELMKETAERSCRCGSARGVRRGGLSRRCCRRYCEGQRRKHYRACHGARIARSTTEVEPQDADVRYRARLSPERSERNKSLV
jgi:hypothetical protein